MRQSLEFNQSERTLSHMAAAMRTLGRPEEADNYAREAKDAWLAAIKRRFTDVPAKNFELKTLDGRTLRLSDLKGKVVLINFWATWCAPCIEEMPYFVTMYQKYKDRGFEILAISVDDKSDLYKVAPFAKQHGLNFTVLFDEGVSSLYGVTGYPTNIFIDREGKERYRAGPIKDVSHLEAVITELLK